MSVTGASDGSGSGLAKYLFFVDNNSNNATQVNADSTGKKTYSYTTTTGYHTCHVSAVDKAGNVSSTKSYAEGRTKLYAYNVYEYGEEWIRTTDTSFSGTKHKQCYSSCESVSQELYFCNWSGSYCLGTRKCMHMICVGCRFYQAFAWDSSERPYGRLTGVLEGEVTCQRGEGVLNRFYCVTCYTGVQKHFVSLSNNSINTGKFQREELLTSYLGGTGVAYGNNCFVNYIGLK